MLTDLRLQAYTPTPRASNPLAVAVKGGSETEGNEAMSEAFGSQLRRWRIAKDLTQEELAQLVGTTQQTIARWERYGMRKMDSAKLRRLDEALGLARGTARDAWVSANDVGDAGSPEVALLREEVERLRQRLEEALAEDEKRRAGATPTLGRSVR